MLVAYLTLHASFLRVSHFVCVPHILRTDLHIICPTQDWLHNEWEKMDATLQSATLGRDWLLQMGRGAAKNNLKVQWQ